MDKIDKLDIRISSVAYDVKEVGKRIGSLEKKMEKMFDKVMTHLVDIAGKFKKFDEERLILSEYSRDYRDRIEKLETAVFSAS